MASFEISLGLCTSCQCRLPLTMFSKSQKKKIASNGEGKCQPCVDGVAPPQIPNCPPVTAEEGYCLTMHQPWASLLVYGIKRLEGRSWIQNDFHGCLWIHAAAHEPDQEDIIMVEEQYRNLYSLDEKVILDGIEEGVGYKSSTSHTEADISFPKSYPTSCLLGVVDVVSCMPQSELQRLDLSPSLRMESEAEYVFVCQNPWRLVPIRSHVSGNHKVWRLSKGDLHGAVSALKSVHSDTDFKPLFNR